MARDLRRTDRVSGGSGGSDPISESEMGSGALSVVGLLRSTRSMAKVSDRAIGNRRGLGKAAGEGCWREKGNQTSKGGEVDQFHE